jgi:26S proteasome regulatory subunit N9
MDHIENIVLTHPELAEKYGQLGSLYERKLWHQLTIALNDFVNDYGNRRDDNFIQLYSKFILKFEGKLNQLELAKIAGVIVKSHTDAAAALKFVDDLIEKKARLGPEATLFLSVVRLSIQLKDRPADITPEGRINALKDIKSLIEEKKIEVDALSGIMDTCVHSAYYQVATEYYKECGPPDAYYKHALMLLAYTPFEKMTEDAAIALATDMSLAALSGEGLYNFGEVLATPIVSALKGTGNAWLGEMLHVFNRGDIEGFATLYDSNEAAFNEQPALASRLPFLKEKLTLISLMNFVFETPAHDRTISFEAVAAHCRLPLDQVEWLAMKAMSLGLIKGSMDEVEQTLQVDWVQPRVLDSAQMGHLVERLGEWSAKVDDTARFIENQTLELGI